MTETELQLAVVYLGGFDDPTNWSSEQHLAGLKRVFTAGADAQRKQDAAVFRGDADA